jgi:hypothetical protein
VRRRPQLAGIDIAAAAWPLHLMAVKFHDVRTPPTAVNAADAIIQRHVG